MRMRKECLVLFSIDSSFSGTTDFGLGQRRFLSKYFIPTFESLILTLALRQV